jgi:hypothetical protein
MTNGTTRNNRSYGLTPLRLEVAVFLLPGSAASWRRWCGRLGARQGGIGKRGRRPLLVRGACGLGQFLPCRERRLRRWGGPRCLGWDRGHLPARAQSPLAAAREHRLLGEPVAWQRSWLTSPTLGRVPGTVAQVVGGGKRKTRENRPLQPKPGGVIMAVMQRTGSSAAGKRWPIIPKWEDRQVCLITCYALS